MTPRRGCLGAICTLSVLAAAAPATADTVRLSNGLSMTVDHVRFEGEYAVIVMPGGGTVRTLRSLILDVIPDEPAGARDLALAALDASRAAGRPQPEQEELMRRIDRAAMKAGIDPRLAHAVIRAESNYRPLAISPKGAMGLMQIMPVLAREYGVQDPFDVDQNLDAGLRHLKRLLGRHDTVSLALAAYNAGEGAVSRYGSIPPYRETQNYVRKVMALYR
jgi:soluble lytic murein transglycosylase-like protein